MTASLSALIIAKDEERDLPGCLESLQGLAQEIILVLDESTRDQTEDIARRAGAKVLRRRFDDYASQRQEGLKAAASEWCLWIDCDERLTLELRREIAQALARADVDGFLIPFHVNFLGRQLRWGGLGRERHLRLFRRQKASFAGGALHEGVELQGPVAALRSAMIHTPYNDISDYLSKLDRYTTLAAQKRFQAGLRARWWHHLLLPWDFFCRTFLRLGVLDGRAGLIWAGLSAFHRWLKYAKLKEMEKTR